MFVNVLNCPWFELNWLQPVDLHLMTSFEPNLTQHNPTYFGLVHWAAEGSQSVLQVLGNIESGLLWPGRVGDYTFHHEGRHLCEMVISTIRPRRMKQDYYNFKSTICWFR